MKKNKFNLMPIKFKANGCLNLKELGDFIAYKKVNLCDKHGLVKKGIATLLIPKDAKIICCAWMNGPNSKADNGKLFKTLSKGRLGKMRASYAKVLNVELLGSKGFLKKKPKNLRALSSYDWDFQYQIGKYVYPDNFNNSSIHVCSGGIHFFRTLEEAINY